MSKIICRKCKGPHLTIKCKTSITNDIGLVSKEPKYIKEAKYIKECKVKINDLPINITEDELRELLRDWGHILYLSIKIYNNSANAIVKFGNEEELNYFVEALNGTPFESNIIHVEKLN